MCGICGQFNFKSGEPVEPESVHRMTLSMTHRGPDDEGFFFSGSLGLGFRRLSIIDLAGGHQPMSDQEGAVWVVFNGEIYNFQELKRELQERGHQFLTSCDTEVIVHGYKEWGMDVLNRLNGMFGLAVWDVEKRRLLLARDAMGIKPLYYQIENGRLMFGSEVRPILAATGERPEVDIAALNLFLRYRYTPAPLTLFEGISKLAAGTRLVVESGEARLERWYRFSPEPFHPQPDDREAEEALLDIYKRAVKRQLISDVPLGLLLSGGIDSGLLLGLMNLHGDAWPVFTVGYGRGFSDDELADAAETARIFSAHFAGVQLDRGTFESVAPQDYFLTGGAGRVLIRCSDVFRVRTGQTGCEGGPYRPGSGRAVRGLYPAPWSQIWSVVAASARVVPKGDRARRFCDPAKRGDQTGLVLPGCPRSDAALPGGVFHPPGS